MSKTAFYSSKVHSLEGLRTWITQQQVGNVFNGVDSWQMVIMSKLRSIGCVDLKTLGVTLGFSPLISISPN